LHTFLRRQDSADDVPGRGTHDASCGCMTTVEQNREAYERFCIEVLVEGDLDAIDELVDPSVTSHSPFAGQAPGSAGFKEALARFRAAFSEVEVSIRDIIAGGDKVVGYFTVSAVHSGPFMGVEPSGKTVTYDEMVIVRYEDGKIVEHWSVADTLTMMRTLGVVTDANDEASSARRPFNVDEERLLLGHGLS
jgi:predicted ester cyclase